MVSPIIYVICPMLLLTKFSSERSRATIKKTRGLIAWECSNWSKQQSSFHDQEVSCKWRKKWLSHTTMMIATLARYEQVWPQWCLLEHSIAKINQNGECRLRPQSRIMINEFNHNDACPNKWSSSLITTISVQTHNRTDWSWWESPDRQLRSRRFITAD